jgi:carboxyl-terminal processing protease
MRKYVIAFTLVASVAVAAPVALQWNNATAQQSNSDETYRLLNLFGDVFERIRADYVEEVTDEELVEAAVNGMLTSLDPHSSFLNARNFKDMQVQTKGQFGGLGIQVSMEEGLVKVISPIDDTPAFRAGIKAGDYITHLDGEPVLGLSLDQAVEKMRGPVDSDIKLIIRRQGTPDPINVTLTRAIIKVESVRQRVEGNVGYIRITSFTENTESGLKKAIQRIKETADQDIVGYVLDMRNNPGGLLDQAIAVSDAFLEKGEIVSTRPRDHEQSSRYNARPGDLVDGKPVVVLINGGSASASEIVAGALQDHRRAVIMGTKSFGKGSVQTIIPLTGYGAIRLTTARYYTPSGRSIQAKGIEPDIEVGQARLEAIDGPQRTTEADLRNSLINDQDNGETPANDNENPEAADTATAADYQLNRALDLIRGIALYSGRAAN